MEGLARINAIARLSGSEGRRVRGRNTEFFGFRETTFILNPGLVCLTVPRCDSEMHLGSKFEVLKVESWELSGRVQWLEAISMDSAVPAL